MALSFRSPAFGDGATIPAQYTCEGANAAPPLEWSGVPEGAVTLLITCEDPDAPRGTFHHWAAYNIAADETAISQAAPQAINDFGKRGYGGPCPPRGDQPHRYVFRIAALSGRIAATPTLRASDIRRLAAPMEMDAAMFTGLFGR